MTKNEQKVQEIVIVIFNFLKNHITLNTDITKKCQYSYSRNKES
jgi:hypothetical protein